RDRRASARTAGPPTSAPSSTDAAGPARDGARAARATPPAAARCRGRRPSEVPAQSLFALDRLEQRLEVPVAEAARAVTLDHLEEESGTVLGGLGEDLQQVAVVVAVGEDAEPAQVAVVLLDLPHALGHVLVVRIRRVEEQ